MKIGFIGLGTMGQPMAHLLARAGHALVVHDRDAETASRFATEYAGAIAATGNTDFADAEIVITMLPDSNAVEAVLLGNDGVPGLASMLKKSATVIDMSAAEPMRSRNLAKTLKKMGLRYLDAAVSGGNRHAVTGTLGIMVGGEAAVLARCEPVLNAMGRTITHVGPHGAGHAMKALDNYVSAAGLVAAVEALHIGKNFGLDPDAMVAVLNGSSGRNNTTQNKAKQFMLSGAFNSGLSLALMARDLGVAMDLAASIGFGAPLGDELLQIWRDANEKLGKGADHTEMYYYYLKNE